MGLLVSKGRDGIIGASPSSSALAAIGCGSSPFTHKEDDKQTEINIIGRVF